MAKGRGRGPWLGPGGLAASACPGASRQRTTAWGSGPTDGGSLIQVNRRLIQALIQVIGPKKPAISTLIQVIRVFQVVWSFKPARTEIHCVPFQPWREKHRRRNWGVLLARTDLLFTW